MPKDDFTNLLLDPASIAANQSGQISPAQRAQIKRPSLVGPSIGIVFFLSLPVPFSCFTFLNEVALFQRSQITSPTMYLFLVIPALIALGFVVPVIHFFRQLLGGLGVRHDLADGVIAYENGEVVFTEKGYRIENAGRPLVNFDGGQMVSLPPGNYRFAHLPRSRRVLSGERLWSSALGGSSAGMLQSLAQTNGFTLEELALNRQGQISAEQRARLSRKRWFDSVRQRKEDDLREGRVEVLEGVVGRKMESSDDSSSYLYIVEGATFKDVDAAALQAELQRISPVFSGDR